MNGVKPTYLPCLSRSALVCQTFAHAPVYLFGIGFCGNIEEKLTDYFNLDLQRWKEGHLILRKMCMIDLKGMLGGKNKLL